MLVGKKAPAIETEAIINGSKQQFSLEQCGDCYKVLIFYPSDFTFVCPTELQGFQDSLGEFTKRNTQVLAISVDSTESHKKWLETPKKQGGIEGVIYPLLSDTTKAISRAYEVLDEDSGKAMRGLFILDKQNIIQAMHVNNLSLGRCITEVLRLLDALKFTEENGEGCPLNWRRGEKGIALTKAGVAEYFEDKKS